MFYFSEIKGKKHFEMTFIIDVLSSLTIHGGTVSASSTCWRIHSEVEGELKPQ